MVNFHTQIPSCDSHSPVLLDLFLWQYHLTFLPLANSDHVDVSLPTDFLSNSKVISLFIAKLMNILVLIWMIFMIIWEIFYERISLNSVLLLLLMKLVNGSKLELMHTSLILSNRLSLIHLHGLQLLVLLP